MLELPAQIERTVPAEYIDENGHVNIGRYLELGGKGLWKRFQSELGMPDSYISERRLSTFTAEHHIRYYSEILQGEDVSVHVRLLERSSRAAHAMSFIVNRTHRRLACTVEVSIVHVDMVHRRPTEFPDDVAELMDAALKTETELDWPAPVCGTMGARRPS